MRRFFALAAVVLVLGLGSGILTPATAQDSTPSAGGAGGERPAVGSEVRYFDADGQEQGAITVREVQDPFADFPADGAPERGARYVLLTVAFEATGEASFAADPYDLVVQDADGFLRGQTSVPREAETAVPDLESHQLASGNRISGAVGFVVPAGAKPVHVFYQPESGQLILLADLSTSPAA